MAFDGGMLKKVIDELKIAVDSHVEKIYQPSRDELVFLLRGKGFSRRLLLCARPGAARIHFTEQRSENPNSPPMFCMLMRKRLSTAKLTDITQSGLERVAELHFLATNEMGDRVGLKIICELIGSRPNIILINGDGRIVDSLRRSDIESGARLIQPGAKYDYPPRQIKADPLTNTPQTLAGMILKKGDIPLSKAIIDTVDGFSPLVCREVVHLTCRNDIPAGDADNASLTSALTSVLENLTNGTKPVLLSRQGVPFEFSYIDILQYGDIVVSREYSNFSALLDAFIPRRKMPTESHTQLMIYQSLLAICAPEPKKNWHFGLRSSKNVKIANRCVFTASS